MNIEGMNFTAKNVKATWRSRLEDNLKSFRSKVVLVRGTPDAPEFHELGDDEKKVPELADIMEAVEKSGFPDVKVASRKVEDAAVFIFLDQALKPAGNVQQPVYDRNGNDTGKTITAEAGDDDAYLVYVPNANTTWKALGRVKES